MQFKLQMERKLSKSTQKTFVFKHSSRPHVCLTGFGGCPEYQSYKRMITEIGCFYTDNLCEETKVLIVNHTATQKYKIAKLTKNPIGCVTLAWLLDCKQKNKLLDCAGYRVRDVFYGVVVGVVGFEGDKIDKIKGLIESNKGIYMPLKFPDKYSSMGLHLIMAAPRLQRQLKANREANGYPIVGIQWLQKSIKRKTCKFPYDYSINSIGDKPSRYLQKLKLRLQIFLGGHLLQNSSSFLSETYIYFSESIDSSLLQVLRKLVCVCGGIFMNKISPILTHILVHNITENDCNQLKEYGNLTHIVRIEWLIDSILLYQKLQEQDYYIRAYKVQEIKSQNSQSKNIVPTFQSRQSISISLKKPVQVRKKKVSSQLFKDINFYLDKSIVRDSEIKTTIHNIKSNSGKIYDEMQSQLGTVYVVLKDSQNNPQIAAKLQKYSKFINIVSCRWINYCVAKEEVVPFYLQNWFIFRPFSFKTPLRAFLQYRFEVIGVDESYRRRIKDTLKALGSMKESPNMSELTHCLCGNNYKSKQSLSKIQSIRKQNSDVKFIQLQWLFDCIENRKVLPIEEHEIDLSKINSMKKEEQSKVDLINESPQKGVSNSCNDSKETKTAQKQEC